MTAIPLPSSRGSIRGWHDNTIAGVPTAHDAQADEGRAAGTSSVRIAEVYTAPHLASVKHARLPACRGKMLFLHLQLEGRSLNRQDQRDALLSPGDFTICDSSRPFEIEFWQPIRMLVVSLPDHIVRRYLQYPQRVTAIPISGDRGVGGVVSEFLVSVWNRCLKERDFDVDPAVADALLVLIAHAYRQEVGSAVERNSLADVYRDRVIRHIEKNLGDPNLTPTHIASSFRITTRYLHLLFSEEQETIARYILRRRLEGCARALTAPTASKRTITEIAFDHGFNSATHFGRAFRSRYNLTPREYRRRYTFEC